MKMRNTKPAEISPKFLRAKNQAGFIPMIIIILIIIAVIVWLAYSRVSSSQ